MNKNIIFDMDMVLCISRPALRRAMDIYFKPLGIKSRFDDDSPLAGKNEKFIFKSICEQNSVKYQDYFLDDILNIYEKIAPSEVLAVEGAKKTVLALKEKGFKIGVASSANLKKVLANIKAIGLNETDFDAIVSADDVENAKPEPDVYLKCAKKIGAEPKNCIAIDDAVNGVISAKRANMLTVGFLTNRSKKDLIDAGADITFNSFDKFLNWVLKDKYNG